MQQDLFDLNRVYDLDNLRDSQSPVKYFFFLTALKVVCHKTAISRGWLAHWKNIKFWNGRTSTFNKRFRFLTTLMFNDQNFMGIKELHHLLRKDVILLCKKIVRDCPIWINRPLSLTCQKRFVWYKRKAHGVFLK